MIYELYVAAFWHGGDEDSIRIGAFTSRARADEALAIVRAKWPDNASWVLEGVTDQLRPDVMAMEKLPE